MMIHIPMASDNPNQLESALASHCCDFQGVYGYHGVTVEED
jgi:hypothetical protein